MAIYPLGPNHQIPFATLSFFLAFQFDKLFLLKLYSLPPKYDESLALLTATMLPYGLLLHLGFSIWSYGQPDLLKSERYSFFVTIDPETGEEKSLVSDYDPVGWSDRVARKNCLYLFMLFLLVFAYLAMRSTMEFLIVKIAVFLQKIISPFIAKLGHTPLGKVLKIIDGILDKFSGNGNMEEDTTVASEEFMPTYTGHFAQEVKPAHTEGYIVDPNDDPMEGVPELTEEQLNEGWEYTDPRTHRPVKGKHGGGAVFKIKKWTKHVKAVPGKQQVCTHFL
jgi:hypothetical protein